MVPFLGMVKLPRSSRWMTRVNVGVPARRLLLIVSHRMPMHHPCHHLETCKYPLGKVTQYLFLHFAFYDLNINIGVNNFLCYLFVET